jgi:hypothetical protein
VVTQNLPKEIEARVLPWSRREDSPRALHVEDDAHDENVALDPWATGVTGVPAIFSQIAFDRPGIFRSPSWRMRPPQWEVSASHVETVLSNS